MSQGSGLRTAPLIPPALCWQLWRSSRSSLKFLEDLGSKFQETSQMQYLVILKEKAIKSQENTTCIPNSPFTIPYKHSKQSSEFTSATHLPVFSLRRAERPPRFRHHQSHYPRPRDCGQQIFATIFLYIYRHK